MKLSLLFAFLPAVLALPAPVLVPQAGTPIPGKYIVKMKNGGSSNLVDAALKLLNTKPSHVYKSNGFGGFAAEISDQIVELLQKLPDVEYIEQDAIITAIDFRIEKKAYTTQKSATWGLARISNKNPGSTSYKYDTTAGADTCAYVIDTGIEIGHPEFEGRAEFLQNYAGDGLDTDGNGHGTHVAGTIGSKTYGVAKKTKLYAVKVLNAQGQGTNSGVIAGINFVASDVGSRNCNKGAVANMSLGGSRSTAVNSAAAGLVSAGVFLAVAAGNNAQDATNYSPASEASAYTVGATDSSDKLASFSNFGSPVDILAPGVSILSTWLNGGTNTISGTSMASPHVAGLGAYLLSFEGQKTPSALSSRLTTLSLKNKITGVPSGTVNRLAFNGATTR